MKWLNLKNNLKKTALRASLCALGLALVAAPTLADPGHGWTGKRTVSEQRSNDLFYNYYASPSPNGAAAQMYVSPMPVPANVGHTYTTYQPLMPHEMMYGHHRNYWNHNQGAGWTRTSVRYGTFGGNMQATAFSMYGDSAPSWWQRMSFNKNVAKR